MAFNTHDLGDLVRVEAVFKDAETNVAFAPDEVFLYVKAPDETVTTYEYGVDAEMLSDATGSYYVNVNADQAGTWIYRWKSTGEGQAAEERRFEIRPSRI